MQELMKEIRQDLREIKETLMELAKDNATQKEILKELDRRSLEMEAKVEPIEKAIAWHDKAFKSLGAIAVGAIIQYLMTAIH